MPLLTELTNAAAVEQTEVRGLVEVYPDGRRLQVRLAHPLYGEVQRARIGRLHARRLRGRIAYALAGTGGRRAGDTLRRAMLMMESDLQLEAVLLTDAAGRATELGDLALAERIARTAVVAGGGFEPRLILGNALGWSGRGAEADAELAAMACSDAQRAQAAIPRLAGLAFTLKRPTEAEEVLDAVTATISDDAAGLELAGMRSVLDAFLGRTVQAAETAVRVLAHPRCSPAATHLAGWALAIACGGLGRIDRVEETLRRIDARVESFEIGVHQAAVVAAMWVRALLLGGLVDRADHTSRRYRERCQNVPGPGDVMTSLMCAEVAKARGQVRTATRWLRQGIAGLRSADPGGWSFVALVALTGALGMTGDATSARQALMEMTAARHPTFAFVEPDALLARAWLAAAEGGVSEAVALGRHAAEVAASQHQPAAELLALHTAVYFGDRTVADRLAQLATQVDGPAPRPPPLTSREREIVTLAAGGLSNRQIADRLVVSVRTVEGHLYRACAKLGASDRAELAALLHDD